MVASLRYLDSTLFSNACVIVFDLVNLEIEGKRLKFLLLGSKHQSSSYSVRSIQLLEFLGFIYL